MKKKVPKSSQTQRKADSPKKRKKKKQTRKSFIEKFLKRNPLFKLTPRQLKYREYRFEHGLSQEDAAIAAGYSHKVARHHAHKIDRVAKCGIVKELERAGASDRWMANQLFDIAKNAVKSQSCMIEARQENGGLVVHEDARVEVPDIHLRKDTIELIARLKKQLTNTAVLEFRDPQKWTIVVESANAASGNTHGANQPAK